MEKFKRICALIGVVLLLLLYLGTFIFSLMGSESAHMMFRACIAGTILIPVSYTHLDVYKRQIHCRLYRFIAMNQPINFMHNLTVNFCRHPFI